MYKRVDENVSEELEGFSYLNRDGDKEVVKLICKTVVTFIPAWDIEGSTVYTDDIPKLIKALQAAYNHQKGIK